MDRLFQAAALHDTIHPREFKTNVTLPKRVSPLEACAEEIIQCLRLLSKQEDRARRELQMLRSGCSEPKKSPIMISIVDMFKTRYLYGEAISVKLKAWSEEGEAPQVHQAPCIVVPILQHQPKSQMLSDTWSRVPTRPECPDFRQEVPQLSRATFILLDLTRLVQNSNLPSHPSWFRLMFELLRGHTILNSCASHRFEIVQDSSGAPKDLWDMTPAADIARVPGLTLQYAARFRARGIYNVSDLAAITPEAAAAMFEAIKQNGPLLESEFTKWIQQARSATKREQMNEPQPEDPTTPKIKPSSPRPHPEPNQSPGGSSTESENPDTPQVACMSPSTAKSPRPTPTPTPTPAAILIRPAPVEAPSDHIGQTLPGLSTEARYREVTQFLAETHQQIERLTRVQSWVCQGLLEQRSSLETIVARKLSSEAAALQTTSAPISAQNKAMGVDHPTAEKQSRLRYAPIIPNEPPPQRNEVLIEAETGSPTISDESTPVTQEKSTSPSICCVCKLADSVAPLTACTWCDKHFHPKCSNKEISRACPSCEAEQIIDTTPSNEKPEAANSGQQAETPLDRLTKILSNPSIPIAGQTPAIRKRELEHGSDDAANKRSRPDNNVAVMHDDEWRPVCELRTRGLRTREKYFQSKPIVFDVLVDALEPSVAQKTMRIVLHLVDGFDLFCDQDLKGDTSYPVGKDLVCSVSNLAINSLSSKKGGHFRFRIELLGRDPGGIEELLGQGITTPFQVQTKRLIFRPKLTDLIPEHSIRLLPKIGPTYGQKMEEKFEIVTIADMAAKLQETDAERVCALVRRERGVLKPDDVRRAISLAKQIVLKNFDTRPPVVPAEQPPVT